MLAYNDLMAVGLIDGLNRLGVSRAGTDQRRRHRRHRAEPAHPPHLDDGGHPNRGRRPGGRRHAAAAWRRPPHHRTSNAPDRTDHSRLIRALPQVAPRARIALRTRGFGPGTLQLKECRYAPRRKRTRYYQAKSAQGRGLRRLSHPVPRRLRRRRAQPAPESTEPVELSIFWWGAEARAKSTEEALKLYTAKHPNVTFKTTWQGNQGYFDKLATLAAGGNAPDIFQIDDNALTEYAERGVTLDLTSYKASGKLDVSKFPESLWKYGEVDGKLVGRRRPARTPRA